MSVEAKIASALFAPNHGETQASTRAFASSLWRWMLFQFNALAVRQRNRRLRVAETISLGEKRFVSIVEVDGEQFLIGGSAANLVLLAKLDSTCTDRSQPVRGSTFSDMLSRAHVSQPNFEPAGSRTAVSDESAP